MLTDAEIIRTLKRELTNTQEGLSGQAAFVRSETGRPTKHSHSDYLRAAQEAQHLENAAHAVEVALREITRAAELDKQPQTR